MYPDSALAAWQLVLMAVVVMASLAVWLTAVFLAAREPSGHAREASRYRGAVMVFSSVLLFPAYLLSRHDDWNSAPSAGPLVAPRGDQSPAPERAPRFAGSPERLRLNVSICELIVRSLAYGCGAR